MCVCVCASVHAFMYSVRGPLLLDRGLSRCVQAAECVCSHGFRHLSQPGGVHLCSRGELSRVAVSVKERWHGLDSGALSCGCG